jgi:hypothetical protein
MMYAFLKAHAVAVERTCQLSEHNARSNLRPGYHPSGCLSNCPLKQLSPYCRSQRHSCVARVVRDLERHNRLVESLPNGQWIIRPERRRQPLQCRPVAKGPRADAVVRPGREEDGVGWVAGERLCSAG